jgi:hypothetical protein
MPVLKQFLLQTELGHDIGYWDMSYHAPRIRADRDENGVGAKVRRAYYSFGEVWGLDDFITEAFRCI